IRVLIVTGFQTGALPISGTTVLYFHGGGCRLGAPRGWIGLAGALARAAGARVVVPGYSLAPEHPFPAAVRDAAAVYEEVLAGGRSEERRVGKRCRTGSHS